MRQNKTKESSQQKEAEVNLLHKQNGFKHTKPSKILIKRGFSEPKINKIALQNIVLGVNDLSLTLNNNVSITKTIPENKITYQLNNNYKKEKISNVIRNDIDINDINLNKNTINIQNIKIENHVTNNLSSNKYLNYKNLQEEIMCQINNTDYVSNKLFEDLNILIKEYPIISKFNDVLFLVKEDFDIFEKIEYNFY